MSPQVQSSLSYNSQELVEIALSLVSSASSVASTEGPPSSVSTVKAFNPTSSDAPQHRDNNRDKASLSITGVPLAALRRQAIDGWVRETLATSSNLSLNNGHHSMPSIGISLPYCQTEISGGRNESCIGNAELLELSRW